MISVLDQSLAQDTSCFVNRVCLEHNFNCSVGQDYACINHHCTCLTTHSCVHSSDCRDIGACHDNRHREVCYQGKCHCADISDVIGGLLDVVG
ncbi:hypothetical protein CHS0354_000917 [Potamilus streckersoni]|uniref:Uncharacterized protein n=1 Tax=Potamilus streckersoni TaxID=2493646 RepID=A0AAE0T713_9BIVA|nr:hypothetical protein CHS0354_000917 [Potamilus streckersoni]